MRADFVVVGQPGICSEAQVLKRPEDLNVQKLVSDTRVKRFDPGVLSRLPGIDKMEQHVVIDRPLQHRAGDVLRAVIDAQAAGVASDSGDVIKRTDHAPAREREIRIEGQPFARKAILDRQQANFPFCHQILVHKVQAPLFIYSRGSWRNVPAHQPYAPLLARPHLQAFLAVKPTQALMVHHDVLALEENLQAAPAEARPLLCDAAEPIANELVIRRLARLVAHRRPWTVRKAAGLALAQALDLERPHRFFAR